jgi:hypothetical protein
MVPVMSELFNVHKRNEDDIRNSDDVIINKLYIKLTERELNPLSNSEARLDLRPRPV